MLWHQSMKPAQLCLLAYLTLTVELTLGLGPSKNTGFTFLLPAGSTECFYQSTAVNDSMEVEYQVSRNFSVVCPFLKMCLFVLVCTLTG